MKGKSLYIPQKEDVDRDLKKLREESENGRIYGGKLTAYKKKIHQDMRLHFIKFSLFAMYGEINFVTLHTLQNIEYKLFEKKSNFGIYKKRFKGFIKSNRTAKDKICKETTEDFLRAVKNTKNLSDILEIEKSEYRQFLYHINSLRYL